MAKKTGESTGRSNRIKFVLVEADISDGNLSELTQAITSALRPSVVQFRQLPPRNGAAALPAGEAAEEEAEIIEQTAEVTEDEQEPATPKITKPKKVKQPEYDNSLFADPEKSKAFKKFAEEKNPESRAQKYVAAAYWLKENGVPSVNADKIYTCFKTAGWQMNFTDWQQTFHNLVHSDHLQKMGNGEFAITPFGESSVVTP